MAGCPLNQEKSTEIMDRDNPTYAGHLRLDKLLTAVEPLSDVHDEYLFITSHQAYEIWFRQIICEMKSIQEMFKSKVANPNFLPIVTSRLQRIIQIWDLLIQQFKVLETMSPMTFAEFRGNLKTTSGLQSFQFRIIENKLGLRKENRVKLNKEPYTAVFKEEHLKLIENSENEKSLFELMQDWLEDFYVKVDATAAFWTLFSKNCSSWFAEERNEANAEEHEEERKKLIEKCVMNEEQFNQILQEEEYKNLIKKGTRVLSWKAMQCVMMINFYHDDPTFHGAYRMINLFMDIDNMIIKWRSSHILLVQRQLGLKSGTGSSSGYFYLRTTIGDRYKPFLDFFNLSSYIIPKRYYPTLEDVERLNVSRVDPKVR